MGRLIIGIMLGVIIRRVRIRGVGNRLLRLMHREQIQVCGNPFLFFVMLIIPPAWLLGRGCLLTVRILVGVQVGC